VQAWDALVSEFINKYVELSGKIGGVVGEQAALVKKLADEERKVLSTAGACKKPDAAVLTKLLAPITALMTQITELREKNRASPLFTNLSTISEGIGAFGWVAVSPTPGPFVNEARAASEFYSNRILKDFKGKDATQTDWVAAWNGFLKELTNYIKKFHTTELAWNARGGDAGAFSPGAAAASGKTPGPPPPGPPKGFADTPAAKPAAKAAAADPSKLFGELNKGIDVTKGLKKVTADMKTKNRPKDEQVSVVPASSDAPKAVRTPGASKGPTKPPKLELNGNKWEVENQVNNKSIVISETEPKQAIYIYQCQNSVIQIKGKINSVMVDSCTKVQVLFENAISVFEAVNSRGVDVQCTGKVPTFGIDKCSGVNVIIGKDGLEAQVVTSKSDAVNVMFPKPGGGEDMIELPIPEQFKTVVKGSGLHTDFVRHE